VLAALATVSATSCGAGTSTEEQGTGGATSDFELDPSGGMSSAAGAGNACAEATTTAALVPTNLLFVVDKSGSMNCNAPPSDVECLLPEKKVPSEPSKWESTFDALVGQDVASTEDIDERGLFPRLLGTQGLSVGLITFPVDDRCEVLPRGELTTDIQSLDSAHVKTLRGALDLVPLGETPLAGAAIRGLDILRAGLVSGQLPGNGYLVLMTDGAETCQQAALTDLKDDVAVALDGFNIHTYVIGAPGSDGARSLLSELAFLGGTAASPECDHGSTTASVGDCHLDLTNSAVFAEDLAGVFAEIAASTQARCDFDVPQSAFVDPNKVNVVFTPGGGEEQTIFFDDRDCATAADGWQYASKEKKQLILCGAACERVRADPSGRTDVVFGCRDAVVR